MNYFVSSPIKTQWKMGSSEFLAKLTEHWPGAKVRRLTDPNFSHGWEIEMPRGRLDGDFNPRFSAISISGDFEDCAAFALWFRSLIPPSVPLLFFDECFNVDTPLTDQTTVADIVTAFSWSKRG